MFMLPSVFECSGAKKVLDSSGGKYGSSQRKMDWECL